MTGPPTIQLTSPIFHGLTSYTSLTFDRDLTPNDQLAIGQAGEWTALLLHIAARAGIPFEAALELSLTDILRIARAINNALGIYQ